MIRLSPGLPTQQARSIDDLPHEVTEPLDAGLARTLDAGELPRAFAATLEALSREVEHIDVDLARRLTPTLMLLGSADPGPA